MKLLIILSLISFNSFAKCLSKAPISAIQQYISSTEPVAGVDCSERPGEECICFDGLPSWQTLDLVDEEVPEERWSGKFNRQLCYTVDQCEELRSTHCDAGKEFFYAVAPDEVGQDSLEAYCAFKLSPEMVKTGRKILKENPVKKAAHEAKLKAEKDAKDAQAVQEAKIQAKIRELAIKELEKEGKQ